MIRINNAHKSQLFFFAFCLIIFCSSAVLGWNKLHYGFNFIDEGYHATESWRLVAGDDFLKDKITGALMHYTLISSIIFKIYPDITLLQLRQFQFILTLAALLLFSLALFRQSRQYAWLPFVFSLFAFTGLDPVGMISNLYYQTYPHLFLVFFLSLMLFGFQSKKDSIKKIFNLLSGLCLWLMNLSLLHMGLIILSPLIIFVLSNKLNLKDFPFSLKDLLYVVFPFTICWILFIAIFNETYLLNLFNSVSLFLPGYSSSGSIHINWEVIKHIAISAVFLSLFFISIKKLPVYFFITVCVLLSLITFLIINTSFFGLIKPYWNGWFSAPMWYASMLMSFTLLFWISTIRKYVLQKISSKEEELAVILMVPFTICALTMSVFSSLGTLAVTQSSIPAVAAISCVLTSQLKKMKFQHPLAIITLILLLGPFYSTTARSDWNFTFFDVRPKQAIVTIDRGFGTGIKTNAAYYNLYQWISKNAEKYSDNDDFIISYVVSPMVHMISKRRPSLDDTFINFAKPLGYYQKSIEFMKKRGRQPKIAFIFEGMPGLVPLSSKGNNTYQWFGKEFVFTSKARDPISKYILGNMALVDKFELSQNNKVHFFVDKNTLRDKQLDQKIAILMGSLSKNPSDPTIHYKLGGLFQRKYMEEKAIEHYLKALDLRPDFINALNNLADIYARHGKYQKAIELMNDIAEIQPDNADVSYNIACMYAKQGNVDESVEWLRNALVMGFDKWELLDNDSDLDNIRNSKYYKELLNTVLKE